MSNFLKQQDKKQDPIIMFNYQLIQKDNIIWILEVKEEGLKLASIPS